MCVTLCLIHASKLLPDQTHAQEAVRLQKQDRTRLQNHKWFRWFRYFHKDWSRYIIGILTCSQGPMNHMNWLMWHVSHTIFSTSYNLNGFISNQYPLESYHIKTISIFNSHISQAMNHRHIKRNPYPASQHVTPVLDATSGSSGVEQDSAHLCKKVRYKSTSWTVDCEHPPGNSEESSPWWKSPRHPPSQPIHQLYKGANGTVASKSLDSSGQSTVERMWPFINY